VGEGDTVLYGVDVVHATEVRGCRGGERKSTRGARGDRGHVQRGLGVVRTQVVDRVGLDVGDQVALLLDQVSVTLALSVGPSP